jgi:hypothetical protein
VVRTDGKGSFSPPPPSFPNLIEINFLRRGGGGPAASGSQKAAKSFKKVKRGGKGKVRRIKGTECPSHPFTEKAHKNGHLILLPKKGRRGKGGLSAMIGWRERENDKRKRPINMKEFAIAAGDKSAKQTFSRRK